VGNCTWAYARARQDASGRQLLYVLRGCLGVALSSQGGSHSEGGPAACSRTKQDAAAQRGDSNSHAALAQEEDSSSSSSSNVEGSGVRSDSRGAWQVSSEGKGFGGGSRRSGERDILGAGRSDFGAAGALPLTLSGLGGQELSNVLWACAVLRFSEEEAEEAEEGDQPPSAAPAAAPPAQEGGQAAAAPAAPSAAAAATPSCAADAAPASSANVAVHSRQLARAVAAELASCSASLKPQALANAAWAAATLKLPDFVFYVQLLQAAGPKVCVRVCVCQSVREGV